MMVLLWRSRNGVSFTVDEMRRQIESLGPEEYRRTGYYERWAFALASLLVEHGVLSSNEIGRHIGRAGSGDNAVGD